jgi:hypothetical protein
LPEKVEDAPLEAVFDDEAGDGEIPLEKVISMGEARMMSADDFWRYCYENEIFSAIKKCMDCMEKEMAEAMSVDLLGTSVTRGCRMMENQSSVVERNKAVIDFINAREIEVRRIFGSAEEE